MPDYDWVVIGSGFGGSVAALRLAEKGYSVCVLEQGRRYADTDFAADASETSKVWWQPRLGLRGIMKLTTFRHVSVISGVGVGGGSLVYANTLYVPRSDDFYRHRAWDGLADWRSELEPHYAEASRMLGVTTCDADGPSERLMRELATDVGAPDAFRNTPVGVYFGERGRTVPDPYFEGEGPDRTGCLRCGQCLLGCRHGAKNTLVKNYLWFAERRGVRVLPDSQVVEVRPLPAPRGSAAGEGGYSVVHRRPGPVSGRPHTLTAGGVVLAAGALGTNKLLRRCRDTGALPDLSPRLGRLVRTNSETITAATSERPGADYTAEVAITASVFPDEHTHFTNNTYGSGGDLMGLNFGPLTSGAVNGRGRRAAASIAAMGRRPGRWLSPGRVRGWSRRTVIFTVMHSTDTALSFRRRRGIAGRLGALQTELEEGSPPPDNYIPLANEIATRAAERIGGYPQSSAMEALLGTPGTAHLLGGAVIGADPGRGVLDERQRAFGYENLLVTDGSAVPANPGVNPSLTITALAERAMSFVDPA